MKRIFTRTGIFLMLFSMSPVIFGHISGEHSLGFTGGLIHMLVDPVHVSMLVVFVILPFLFVMRKKIMLFLDWILTNVFRS